MDDPVELPFELFRSDLDSLLTSFLLKVRREWPSDVPRHPESPTTLWQLIGVVDNTYHAMRYLCADAPPDPARKLEYGLAATPLARVVLEVVFTTFQLAEDFPEQTLRFHRGGWTLLVAENRRFRATYGHLPEWAEFLATRESYESPLADLVSLTPEERADPASIAWWPTPRKILDRWTGTPDRKIFLSYLYDWFYRSLSEDAHVSAPGLARMSAHLMPMEDADRDRMLRKRKSDILATTIALILVLLSEIELVLRFGATPKLRYLWGVLNEAFDFSKELYEARYAEMLK